MHIQEATYQALAGSVLPAVARAIHFAERIITTDKVCCASAKPTLRDIESRYINQGCGKSRGPPSLRYPRANNRGVSE